MGRGPARIGAGERSRDEQVGRGPARIGAGEVPSKDSGKPPTHPLLEKNGPAEIQKKRALDEQRLRTKPEPRQSLSALQPEPN